MNTLNFNAIKAAHKLQHVDYEFDSDDGILWVYLDSFPRPCVTPELVDDIRSIQRLLEINKGRFPANGNLETVKYHVLDSHVPGVFSLGGDLSHFLQCIHSGDKPAIEKYARNCINAIYPIMVNFNLPVVTISLVRGNALGGGFEIALSGDVIIAERSAQMGFPEILFNLFPGMGAFQMLSRRIGLNRARRMITSGKLYSAEELYDLGIVDVLVDDGYGQEAVYSFISNHSKHWNGHMAIQQVMKKMDQYDYDELMEICSNTWVDAVFSISEKDVRTISRLIRSQEKFAVYESHLPVVQATAL
jgi:DSF synthase